MKHIKTIGFLAFFFLSPGSSFGAARDGNQLLSDCGAAAAGTDGQKLDSVKREAGAFCYGVMHGMLSMNEIYEYHLKGAALFCTPDGVTTAQAARIVVKFLRDHPEELHNTATLSTFMALREAFPCAKK